MSDPQLQSNKLLTDVENFLKTEINYLEVSSTQKFAQATSRFCLVFITFLLVCILLLALALGIAWWIGSKVNNYVLGFIFVAVLVITIFSFFTIFHDSFIRLTRNKLISVIYH